MLEMKNGLLVAQSVRSFAENTVFNSFVVTFRWVNE